MSLSSWVAATLASTLLLAGCARASNGAPQPSPEATSGHSGEGASTTSAQPDNARYPHTVADVRFMSQMIHHHAQAVVISGWAASHGASPAVRRLAERIVNGQQDEIATMQQWLRDRGQPEPKLPATWDGMADHHSHRMPGLLTGAQMKELDRARGAEFDRLFLSYMIQHHRGAVDMVRDLFGTPGAAQDETVFKFASDVHVDQSTEIARMERMLAAMADQGRSR